MYQKQIIGSEHQNHDKAQSGQSACAFFLLQKGRRKICKGGTKGQEKNKISKIRSFSVSEDFLKMYPGQS